ncbi:YcjX family protein [Desulfonatronospira sp.]|uniref:YcjX family protein n=1 Tax=Desulfonatronospira sp. TaxID=1962951 RepID=UPI0025C2BC1B|nr:YcjX family protein [Desulfonatronospira sp.]
MKSFMRNALNLRQHNNVVVTGIAGGGKTVFITSLVSHLMEFGQGHFHVGKGVDITDFREIPSRGDWPPYFTHSTFREELARGRWPQKTMDCSQYTCQFRRSDWMLHTQRMSFFDFPGERIADAAIAAFNSYSQWSDHVLSHFSRHHDYARAAGPYLEYIRGQKIETQRLLALYRETLARLILAYKPLITPSVFLLDQQGQTAAPGTVEEIASSRPAGLTAGRQFAPLPEKARRDNPELARKMSVEYRIYRKEVALPVFENISQAGSLVVLVDIPSLLAGGVGRYNDNRQILLDLFEIMRPRSDLGTLLLRYLKFWQKRLNRVAFVAAKADLVHPMDIENRRLIGLLRMMTERAGKMLPQVKSEWFVCSACHSTFPVSGVRRLKGKIARDNPGREFKEYSVPELPVTWPENWSAGDYPFFRVYPDAPENYLIPPRHLGLDRVFEFISS